RSPRAVEVFIVIGGANQRPSPVNDTVGAAASGSLHKPDWTGSPPALSGRVARPPTRPMFPWRGRPVCIPCATQQPGRHLAPVSRATVKRCWAYILRHL